MLEAPGEPVDKDIRHEERKVLIDWLDADHGSVVLIHGPRGVGKARLAEHLEQAAAQRPDVAALVARCPQAGARSFHPFAELARQAIMWAEQRGRSEQLVDPVYAELGPVLDHAAGEDADHDAPSLNQKLAFFEGFRRLLGGIASEARLCAIVHEIERADADTLELASYLADELFADPALEPGLSGRGVLVLLAREDESTEGRLRDFVADMKEHRTVRCLELRGLDLEGLRRYVQSPHVLEKLFAASSGLPQEVDALIEALPSNVEELFERRLESLDSLSRELLVALSISGRPATARQLSEVSRHPMKEVAKALNSLRSSRILTRRIHSGEFHFAFRRRRDLEVCQRSVGPEDRARLHGTWAQALSQEMEVGGSALLAHHQLRSGEPLRGVPLAIQAAETHAVAGAINAAIEILEDARPHAASELKLAILSRLAELAPLTGNPRSALRYVEEWKSALQDSERGPALRREAELHNVAGDYRLALEAVAVARDLLSSQGADHAERAGLEATASEAHYHLSDLEEARTCCEVGLDLLAAAGSVASATRVRLDLLNQLGKIALADGDGARAIRFFRETLDTAEQHALASEEARSLVNIGIVELRHNDLAAAERSLSAGIEKARQANDLSRLAFGYMSIGALHHQAGQLGKAIKAYRECRSLFRRLANRTQLARVMNNLGNLYFLCGDLARARAYNDEALRLAEVSNVERVLGIATVVDGVILAEEARFEEAESRLREGMILQQRLGGERPIEAMTELCELYHRTGATDRARAILEEARDALARVPSPVLEARVRYLGGLLDPGADNALKLLESARDAFHRLGRRLLERDAELGLARALGARGRTEMARVRLEVARRLQEDVAESLPGDVKAHFRAARPQREVELVAAALEGSHAPEIVPNGARPRADEAVLTQTPLGAPRAEPPAPPVRRSLVSRKEEWKTRYGAIIGSSPKLLRVFHILDRVAHSDGTILVVGESGTGKELIAEAIHRNSARAGGPFVKLNCAALVESLLLSELFGHERGSFTGAHQRKIGRFEMAAGGTLFLDEIGDISPKTQVALLRVLQEREFERVGGGQTLSLDARVVFATNRNLAQMVRDGTFREDLYYRLKGITIDLPPLRDRTEDIVALAEHFLGQFARESGTPAKHLTEKSVELLIRYPWPGNIRELENIIRSVALFAEGDAVTARDFDEYRELFQDAPLLGRLPEEVPCPDEVEGAAARLLSRPRPAPGAGARAETPRPTTVPFPVSPSPTVVASGSFLGERPPSPPESGQREDVANDGTGPADAAWAPVSRPGPDRADPTQDPPSDLLGQIFVEGIPLPELKKRIQSEAIARALRMTEGNITKAAEVLGMRRPRLSQIINADEDLKRLAQGASR